MTARRLAATLVALCAMAGGAGAIENDRYERHWRQRAGVPPLPYPEVLHPDDPIPYPTGFVMTIVKRPDLDDRLAHRSLDRAREVAERLAECWTPPTASNSAKREITLRLAFSRVGALIGPPRVTYVDASGARGGRHAIVESITDALKACAPLRFTASLGAAIAGYPFAIRFVAASDTAQPKP